jgi:hypothetical protein
MYFDIIIFRFGAFLDLPVIEYDRKEYILKLVLNTDHGIKKRISCWNNKRG